MENYKSTVLDSSTSADRMDGKEDKENDVENNQAALQLINEISLEILNNPNSEDMNKLFCILESIGSIDIIDPLQKLIKSLIKYVSNIQVNQEIISCILHLFISLINKGYSDYISANIDHPLVVLFKVWTCSRNIDISISTIRIISATISQNEEIFQLFYQNGIFNAFSQITDENILISISSVVLKCTKNLFQTDIGLYNQIAIDYLTSPSLGVMTNILKSLTEVADNVPEFFDDSPILILLCDLVFHREPRIALLAIDIIIKLDSIDFYDMIDVQRLLKLTLINDTKETVESVCKLFLGISNTHPELLSEDIVEFVSERARTGCNQTQYASIRFICYIFREKDLNKALLNKSTIKAISWVLEDSDHSCFIDVVNSLLHVTSSESGKELLVNNIDPEIIDSNFIGDSKTEEKLNLLIETLKNYQN